MIVLVSLIVLLRRLLHLTLSLVVGGVWGKTNIVLVMCTCAVSVSFGNIWPL